MDGNDIGRSRNSNGSLLPEDLIINILKRLPVKTLIQFKCVAKDWKKLIESSHFIAQHLSHSASINTFLYTKPNHDPMIAIGPDLEAHIPQFMDFTGSVIGSCNGLLCVNDTNSHNLFIRNPATRQVKQVPETLIDLHHCVFGFGFSHLANDYKIVKIYFRDDFDDQFIGAEVYSLTTGSWKEINILHLHNFRLEYFSSATANGAMFWQVYGISDSDSVSDVDPHHDFLVSFDIAQEVFTLFKGPSHSQPFDTRSYIDKLAVHQDKLAVFRRIDGNDFPSCSVDVWVLEDTCGAKEYWVKKFSVGPFPWILNPICFWSDGIVCQGNCFFGNDQDITLLTFLVLINPISNELKSLPVGRHWYFRAIFDYTESLIPVGNIHHGV